jgi:glycosidase
MKNIIILLIPLMFACSQKKENTTNQQTNFERAYKHLEWTKNTNIYEVNIRQYTPEGTFKAFEKHLPRLKNMGVDVLWIMPIHPIGKKNHKGSLGSYYAVKDYRKINPEFGTLDDFKSIVNTAHNLGMKVIIDWVANHTAWDNRLIIEHPDWYTHDSTGKIISPVPDWEDVADLNYDNVEMREYMTESMEYWLKETNIDGFRCDVAGMVPTDFWIETRKRLDAIKPVFMLAEWETKDILQAFDVIYGWEFHHIMNEVAQGKKSVTDIKNYFIKHDSVFSADDYIMYFTSNHDENSWNGSEYERMGNAVKIMAVLSATIPNIPLLYSGQEDKLSKRLSFFDKDTIVWRNFELQNFYSKLLYLKKNNKALWNGTNGGSFTIIDNSTPDLVFSFLRKKDNYKVLVITNMSDKAIKVTLKNKIVSGEYKSLFDNKDFNISGNTILKLSAWKYLILVNK